MIAPTHKIIIDKDADYEIWIQVPATTTSSLNVSGYKWIFQLYNSKGAKLVNAAPIIYSFTDTCPGTVENPDTDSIDGWVKVKIDSAKTTKLPTNPTDTDETTFNTVYNYRYTITIKEDTEVEDTSTTKELRIARGKCAVRV